MVQIILSSLCNKSGGILILAMQVADIAQPERESNFVSDRIADTDCNVRIEYFDDSWVSAKWGSRSALRLKDSGSLRTIFSMT